MNANCSCVVVARLFLAGVLVSMLFGGVASAGPVISYDFRGGGGPANNPLGLDVGVLGASVTVTQDGVPVNIIGRDYEDDPGPSADLNRALNGLGVADQRGAALVGPDEAIEFDFGPLEVVALSSIVFEGGGTKGRFDLLVDGLLVETFRMATGHITPVTHTFTAPVPSGSVLQLAGNKGYFRISSLTVEVVPVSGLTVEVVPEPGMVWLLLPGLIGLGFGRKAG